MDRLSWLLVVAASACGSASPPVVAQTTPPAPKPTVPVKREAKVSIENVLVAGPRQATDIENRLLSVRDAIATCSETEVSVAVQIQFAVASDDQISSVGAHGASLDGPLLACIANALGSLEQDTETMKDPTYVYAVVAVDLEGLDPAERPAPPVLRDDVETLCNMFTRSGATEKPAGEAFAVATAWARERIRHPIVIHHGRRIGSAKPADAKRIQRSLLDKAKDVTCEDPQWRRKR